MLRPLLKKGGRDTPEKKTNSHLNASNITIKSSEDTLVRGGVVRADNDLTLDVGGNLKVESIQDVNKSHSVTVGLSGGAGGKTDSGSVDINSGNGGVNLNISKSDSKWVTEQTSLTSGGNVDIDVENKTTLRGAVIASDTGDLTFETGSFEYSHIKDKDKSYNVGGGGNFGGSDSWSANTEYGFSDKRQTNFATIGEGTITIRDGSSIGTPDQYSGLKRDVSQAQYITKEGGLQGGFVIDSTTVNFVTNFPETISKTADKVGDGLTEAKNTSVLIYKEADKVAEKTGNLVEHGHYTTNGQLIYYNNIDEYNNLKATGGTITSQQELIYIGSRELIGDPLSNEELKDTSISYLQKRGDEYAVEGATKGYFKDYNNTLMFNNYLNLKLELVNKEIDLLPLTDSDKINLSRTLKQGAGEALSIQLQNELKLSPTQANYIADRSCKAGIEYMLLKLEGANVSTYPSFFRENNSEGLISNRAEVQYGLVEKYGYKLVQSNDYNNLVSGKGGENIEIRILQNYGQKNEKGYYERHSIYGFTSDDGNRKNF
jgi:hypothetical protein